MTTTGPVHKSVMAPVRSTPEDDAFRRFRATGAPEALACVFDATALGLTLLAGHLAHDAAEAEDLVQQTFLVALRDAERWDDTRPIGAWLAGILRHRALDLARARRAHPDEELAEHTSRSPGPLESAASLETFERVTEALERIYGLSRQVLVLRLVHGLEPRAIAHALGRPPGAVRMQLQRGLERLRGLMPVGAALGALLALDTRGLAAMRATVLAEAGAGVGAAAALTTTTTTTTIGALCVQKWTLATAAILLAALTLHLALDSSTERATAGSSLDTLAATSTDGTTASKERAEVAAPDAGGPRTAAAPFAPEDSVAHDWSIAGHVRLGTYGKLPDAPVIIRLFAGLGVTGEPLVEVRVRSDANGEFTWSAPAPAGTVTLQVIADLDGHKAFPDVRTALVGDPGPQNLQPAAYVLDTWISGRVVDTEGSGVAGARVITSLSDERTNDDGSYRVSMFSGYPVTTLRVIAAGFATEVIALGLLRAGDVEAEAIVLRREAAVRGRVVDASGQPVAGAEVSCHLSRELRTTTTEDGRFRLGSLDPSVASTRVSASAEGYVSTTHTVTAETLGAAAEVELDVVLRRGASVSGRVIDERGRGVPHAIVTWGGYPNSIGPRITCADESGAFTLGVVPSGRQSIWARRKGLSADKITVEVPGPGESLTNQDIVLGPGHRITGRVVDPLDQPVASAEVRPEPIGFGAEMYAGDPVRTDRDGRFDLQHLRDEQVRLIVDAEGFTRLEQAARAGRDVTLRLGSAGGIAGLVVDGATGAPIDSFVVRLVPARREAQDRQLALGAEWAHSGRSFHGTDGVWSTTSERLDVGAVTGVEVSASGYAATLVERVVVSSSPAPSELRIELHRGVTLRGSVVDAGTGVPLASARVRRFTRGDERYAADEEHVTRTDAAGSFRLERVPFGTMYLVVDETERPLTIDGPFSVSPPSSTVERTIEVTSGGGIGGRFLDGAGLPLARQRVMLTALDTPGDERATHRAETDADGAFHFEQLVRGLYHLHGSVTEAGSSLAVGAGLLRLVEVEDGRTLEVELRPTGRATVTGTIEFDGVLPDTIRVELRPPQPSGQWVSKVTYAGVRAGSFRAPFLEAGEWGVSVFFIDEDGRMVTGGTKVQVPEEGTVDVRFALAVAGG